MRSCCLLLIWGPVYEWVCLWQPGGVREGEEGQWEGKAYLHEKSSLRPVARMDKRKVRIQQEVTCRATYSSLFSSGREREEERGKSRRGKRGRSKWDKQHSHSWCVRSRSSRMCRDPRNSWKQDWTRQKKREGGQKDTGQKEGRRVEEEIWRSFPIFWDLISAKDRVGKVCYRSWATALPWS